MQTSVQKDEHRRVYPQLHKVQGSFQRQDAFKVIRTLSSRDTPKGPSDTILLPKRDLDRFAIRLKPKVSYSDDDLFEKHSIEILSDLYPIVKPFLYWQGDTISVNLDMNPKEVFEEILADLWRYLKSRGIDPKYNQLHLIKPKDRWELELRQLEQLSLDCWLFECHNIWDKRYDYPVTVACIMSIIRHLYSIFELYYHSYWYEGEESMLEGDIDYLEDLKNNKQEYDKEDLVYLKKILRSNKTGSKIHFEKAMDRLREIPLDDIMNCSCEEEPFTFARQLAEIAIGIPNIFEHGEWTSCDEGEVHAATILLGIWEYESNMDNRVITAIDDQVNNQGMNGYIQKTIFPKVTFNDEFEEFRIGINTFISKLNEFGRIDPSVSSGGKYNPNTYLGPIRKRT